MYAKQQRLLAILAGVLLVLVAIIIYVKPPEKVEDGEKKPTVVFDGLKKADIQHIEIQRADGLLILDLLEGTWRISKPLDVLADQRKVDDILWRLSELKSTDSIQTVDFEPFGLGPSAVKVRWTTNDGTNREMLIGRDAPVGSSTYVRVADGPVLVVGGKIADDFTRTVDELRDHQVWRFSASEVDRITWRWTPPLPTPEESLAARKVGKDAPPSSPASVSGSLRRDVHGWWLGDDGPRADDEKVSAFLREADDLRVDAFTIPTPEPPSYDVGEMILTEKGARSSIALGPSGPSGVPARVPLIKAPVLLSASAVELLQKDPASFLSKSILPVRRATVDRLLVVLGDERLETTKSETGWSDPRAVAFLEALDELEVRRPLTSPAVDPATDWAWGRIELGEGGTRLEAVSLGAATAEGTHPVRDEAGGPPLFVADHALSSLLGALMEKSDPHLPDDDAPLDQPAP